jgi:uncharacterized protein (TIGR02996 family)
MSWWSRLFRRGAPAPEPEPTIPDAPLTTARDPEQEAAIEAALAEDPDATAELLVYGDWLGAQGDPRGELIAIQAQLSRAPGTWQRRYAPTTIEPLRVPTGEHLAAADALLRRRTRFLGDLKPYKKKGRYDEVDWHAGFWRTLRFRPDSESTASQRAEITAALAHPSARFLRSLRIGTHWHEAVADLLPASLPRTLRELYLGDFTFPDESELSWSICGDISAIYELAPQLEHLVLQGESIEVGSTVALPRLRSLELITTNALESTIFAIASSPLDALESLVVWTGGQPDDPRTDDDVAELLRTDRPNLRHLGIRNSQNSDRIVAALVESPLVPRLRTLDLSLGCLTAVGANLLAGARDRFARLERLDLSENLLPEVAGGELARVAREVVFGEQRDDDDGDEHYAPIGE